MAKKKKPRKGFTRSSKEWEESIATHIGHLIDNLKGEDLLNLIAGAGCAYAGYNAAVIAGADIAGQIGAAGSGIIAFQLAKSMNVIAGGSGTAYLAALGLINVWNPLVSTLEVAYGAVTPRNIDDVAEEYEEPIKGQEVAKGVFKMTCSEGYHLERVTTEYPRLKYICVKNPT